MKPNHMSFSNIRIIHNGSNCLCIKLNYLIGSRRRVRHSEARRIYCYYPIGLNQIRKCSFVHDRTTGCLMQEDNRLSTSQILIVDLPMIRTCVTSSHRCTVTLLSEAINTAPLWGLTTDCSKASSLKSPLVPNPKCKYRTPKDVSWFSFLRVNTGV